jgi:Protein of unknown function (DUF2778)
LLHIGVRSICAGIAAIAVGVTLESAGRYVAGALGAGVPARSAPISALATARPKTLDHRAPLVRVASLGAAFAFEPAVEASEPSTATGYGASFGERFSFDQDRISFGERFVFDQKLASFDERFAIAGNSVATSEERTGSVLSYARVPLPGAEERTIAAPASTRSAPKLASAPSSAPASVVRKRLASLEPTTRDSTSAPEDDRHTAIYDISARTVYLPNGRRLEAHSGLGSHMDDVRYVNLKGQGPTPPNTYKLLMREAPFHGVRAIRLVPVGDGNMFGREGILAHSYMLGPNGDSNGCVSFNDYDAFLNAYLNGEVDRLVVVERLATPPSPATAWGWVESFKDLFRRS